MRQGSNVIAFFAKPLYWANIYVHWQWYVHVLVSIFSLNEEFNKISNEDVLHDELGWTTASVIRLPTGVY